ncbi:MAG: DUF885 domain-containing protein [Thermoplasmata archaeon]|nr:DUF885 domain-containing protein [Thermoplasmata archaeon]
MSARPDLESTDRSELGLLEAEVVDHVFHLSPGYAVFLGLHRYDGRVPDLSASATAEWVAHSLRLLERLRAVPEDRLSEPRRLDRMLLELLLESSLFDLTESFDLERNPMSFVGAVSLTSYMVREYAPLADRVEAMVRALEAVPRLMAQGRARLRPELPKPFVQLAISMGGGLPSHFAEAEEAARRGGAELGGRVAAARAPAEVADLDFLHRLREEWLPRAVDEFALGAERYQRLLWVREGIRTPTAEVLASGRADLARNQARLKEIARGSVPPVTVEALLEGMYRRHTTAANLVPQAQAFVNETREFVEAQKLVTIPTPSSCRVEETPSYGRALSTASMNPPGPFDVAGDEGIYFVTPVDPTWSPERQEQWLRSMNDPMLRNITVHEVYPGHYLQFLHFRRGAASLTRKVYLSASFTEGWAHYAEQLAVEAGLGAGSPEAEVAQLHDALLRDCRLIASIGLHTGGMSLPEATQLFQREAYFEALPAEREAVRGTFNPEYFCYTLGKLAILDARTKFLAGAFGGSLRAFHDRLLSFGCPPVGLLETLLSGA